MHEFSHACLVSFVLINESIYILLCMDRTAVHRIIGTVWLCPKKFGTLHPPTRAHPQWRIKSGKRDASSAGIQQIFVREKYRQ